MRDVPSFALTSNDALFWQVVLLSFYVAHVRGEVLLRALPALSARQVLQRCGFGVVLGCEVGPHCFHFLQLVVVDFFDFAHLRQIGKVLDCIVVNLQDCIVAPNHLDFYPIGMLLWYHQGYDGHAFSLDQIVLIVLPSALPLD